MPTFEETDLVRESGRVLRHIGERLQTQSVDVDVSFGVRGSGEELDFDYDEQLLHIWQADLDGHAATFTLRPKPYRRNAPVCKTVLSHSRVGQATELTRTLLSDQVGKAILRTSTKHGRDSSQVPRDALDEASLKSISELAHDAAQFSFKRLEDPDEKRFVIGGMSDESFVALQAPLIPIIGQLAVVAGNYAAEPPDDSTLEVRAAFRGCHYRLYDLSRPGHPRPSASFTMYGHNRETRRSAVFELTARNVGHELVEVATSLETRRPIAETSREVTKDRIKPAGMNSNELILEKRSRVGGQEPRTDSVEPCAPDAIVHLAQRAVAIVRGESTK